MAYQNGLRVQESSLEASAIRMICGTRVPTAVISDRWWSGENRNN